jgi:hypothetical protein
VVRNHRNPTGATMHGNHRQGQLSVGRSPVVRDKRRPPATTDRNDRRISIIFQHTIRIRFRSLRRTDLIRIMTHNASEPSLSD